MDSTSAKPSYELVTASYQVDALLTDLLWVLGAKPGLMSYAALSELCVAYELYAVPHWATPSTGLRIVLWATPSPMSYAVFCAPTHLMIYAALFELRFGLWATPRSLNYASACELRRGLWATPRLMSYAAVFELRLGLLSSPWSLSFFAPQYAFKKLLQFFS